MTILTSQRSTRYLISKLDVLLSYLNLPIIIFLLLSLHTHLPHPQRLSQTTCKTRRPAIALAIHAGIGRIPPAASATRAHTHCAIPCRWRRSGFLVATWSFWWGRWCGFRFRSRGTSGAVDAICRCCRGWGWDSAGDWLRRCGWWNGFWRFLGEVCRGNPALGGAVKLFGEPPA